MDRHVEAFFVHFNRHYADALATDFGDLSLQQQVSYVRLLCKVHVHVVMYSDCYMYMYMYMYMYISVCSRDLYIILYSGQFNFKLPVVSHVHNQYAYNV